MGEIGRRGLSPKIVAEDRTGDRARLQLFVPEKLDVWPGHFPDFLVVPGVLQLEWVVRIAAARFGAGALERIDSMKFKMPMRPGQRFTLELDLSCGGRELAFRMEHEGVVFSIGRLSLAEPRS